MIEAMILTFGIVISIFCIILLLFRNEGTNGIEKEPYYGRKTGKLYTAKSTRKDYRI